jgi:hypothetical protein
MRLYRPLLIALMCGMSGLTAHAAAPTGELSRYTAAEPRLEMHVVDGLLTVRLRHAPWAAVLPELTRHTGIQFRVEGVFAGTVTEAFEGLPVEQGLRRVFRGANVLFVYTGGQGRAEAATLKHVWAFPKDGSPVTARQSAATAHGGPDSARPEPVDPGERMAQERFAQEESTGEGELAAEADQEARLLELYTHAQQGYIAALRQAVFDPDQTLQATAVELLAERDPQATVMLLSEAAQHERPTQRLQALQLLTALAGGQTVLAALGRALVDEDVAVKSYAIQALADQGGQEAAIALRAALHDPDPAVRLRVLESATPWEPGRVLLQEALADEDADVRAVATYWLEQAGPPGQ